MKDDPTPVFLTEQKEKEKRTMRMLLFALIVCISLFVDQITKLLAFCYVPPQGIPLIKGVIGFSRVENDAIAFGIGSGNHAFMVVIMIVTAILMVGIPLLTFTVFRKNGAAQICLSVIEGGAIGNFVDRLFVKNAQGVAVVRDFVDLTRFGFANCNIADFCITFGAAVLVFIILFIGPQAVFPLKKEWREQAREEERRTEDK